jgi:A/G-specific adenine glycosylase
MPLPAVASPPARRLPEAAALLRWYDRHRRRMPWRALPGAAADPYRVWLSEVMLQQTTVAAVIPYYDRFVSRFPTVAALAEAPLDEVLAAWAGLGYYARARNLHACARAVAASGGGFPRDRAGLLALPGIGPYTATAIAAIAYDQPGVPVDGNVERVVARLFAIETPLPAAKPACCEAAVRLGADPDAVAHPSDFAQALFDLGATVCTPEKPACAICPWHDACAGRARGIAASLPRRAAKPVRPRRHGAHFWLTDGESCALRRRPPRGLLGGMEELPGTPWRAEPWPWQEAAAHAPAAADWRPAGKIRHVFTHFELWIDLYAAQVSPLPPGLVRRLAELDRAALPSVMRKCVAMACGR